MTQPPENHQYGSPAGSPPPGYPYAPPYRPTNTLAIIAIIAAFVMPVAAIVLGHVARSQIRRTHEEGWTLTTLSLVFGYVFTAFGAMFFVVWVVFFILAITSPGFGH
ncbi:MAG: hypothetical protein JWP75_3000 [Frondihabitans sp.]|nr:hypothetical protein [Frondihabitans sp.]